MDEAMLRAFIDRMPESVTICDLDGRVLYANHASDRMFGGSRIGQRIWELSPDIIGRPFHAAFLHVAAGGPAEESVDRHGERWLATRVERQGDRVHLVARDITDARRERAERESLRQRLAILADALPALVAFVDTDRRYRYINAAFAQWFGRSREAVLGTRIDELTPPAMYALIAPYVARALAGETVQFRGRFAYPDAAREVDVRYAPLRDGDELIGFAVLVLDITREHELVESQRRAAERLERLLEVARQLAVATTPDEVGRAVIDAGIEALDATMAGMWLADNTAPSDGDELVLARSRGFVAEHHRAFSRVARSGAGPIAACARDGRPIWVRSRAEYAARYGEFEEQYRPTAPPPLAFSAMPVFVDGAAIGVLAYVFHDERRVTAEERAYLEVLASHASSALARVRLHARLVEALEIRQAMIQASPTAIVLLDAEARVHAWNTAAERIFGWSADEVLGKPLPGVPDEQRDEVMARLGEVTAGGTASGVEAMRRTRDGGSVDVEIHSAPVRRAADAPLCLSIIVDISERKRVERGREMVARGGAVLARSLDWEQTIEKAVGVPVPSFADWCIVHLVEGDALRAIATSGAPDPRRLGPHTIAHDASHGGASRAIATGQPQLMVDIDDVVRRRIARDEAHYERLRAANMRSYLCTPMRAGGRVIGAFTFGARNRNFDALDVTIAEGLAAQAAGAIENARLYREATSARAEAEDASRAKDEFLAMLGHELRNPLAPISTALQLMTVRPSPHVREREVIARQVDHLTRLVDDLLDISRVTRGKIELARQRTTIEVVAARAVELASPLLEQRDHRLHVEIAPDLVIDADPTRLAQVLANLLTNAARYTPPHGLVEIAARRDGGEIVVVVRDNGIGIPADALPRIFDAFVQGPRSIARTQGGLGLGLAIVKSIVELHGGQVAARSAGAGHGAELEVRLPAAVGAVAPRRTPTRMTVSGPRRRVLIVDDNQDAAELLAELLDASGHEIRTAFDGPGALRVADEFEPEIALLDIGLPVMDGYELAERLRARYHALRLVAVTGYGQAADHERSRNAGFDVHLTKPVTLDVLERVLTGVRA